MCGTFWLYGFEIEGDEFGGQYTCAFVHECHVRGFFGGHSCTSRTIPGTLGLWALVVDGAPHDVKDMSEGLLATMIKDTELEEAAYDEDFLLVRAVTTGRKHYEEVVRDIDELKMT